MGLLVILWLAIAYRKYTDLPLFSVASPSQCCILRSVDSSCIQELLAPSAGAGLAGLLARRKSLVAFSTNFQTATASEGRIDLSLGLKLKDVECVGSMTNAQN